MSKPSFISKFSLNDWIQIVTGIAVVVGLTLVVLELRQSRELARAQLATDNSVFFTNPRNLVLGENPAAVIAKACSAPDQLNIEEMEIMNSWFHLLLAPSVRAASIAGVSTLYDLEDSEYFARNVFPSIFAFHYGQYWWPLVRNFYMRTNPAMAAVGDEVLSQMQEDFNCFSYAQEYLDSF